MIVSSFSYSNASTSHIQTSGGLLAVMPAEDAENAVYLLKAAGYRHAAIIGEIVNQPPLDLSKHITLAV